MLNRKEGFSLIEVMVGLVITSIIVVTLVPWGMRTIIYYHRSYCILQQAIECETARTIIIRDIITGSKNKATWHFENDRFAFRTQDGNWCGFALQNNTFTRITASKNPFLNLSSRYKSIPLMRNISQCTITPVYNNNELTYVAISLKHRINDYLIKGSPRYAYY